MIHVCHTCSFFLSVLHKRTPEEYHCVLLWLCFVVLVRSGPYGRAERRDDETAFRFLQNA